MYSNHPLVYEINTRCWLRELSDLAGGPINLGTVPEAEFIRWQRLGFTHIWLMGVWPTGPRSRAQALAHSGQARHFDKILPDWREDDVAGSPFAIADHRVAESLGGEPALQHFKERLHTHGLKLILDFVPNHLGLDHRWVTERPEFFVQSESKSPGFFRQETMAGPHWLAHGRDPYFPAWDDTVQLDYRRADTRAAMLEVLQSIVPLCDGVRCDMAMLLLNDVFAKSWADFPCPAPPATGEFWADAIQTIKQSHPEFLFLGEVYWGLEARLQSFGFDFTYDKRLYDHLLEHNHHAAAYLSHLSLEFIRASAHFLENHDEARIASLLDLPKHRAAVLLILGLPGFRLLHEGQLTGAQIRASVHLSRRPYETVQPDIETIYEKLLTTLRDSAVGRGNVEVLQPRIAWFDNPTVKNVAIIQWQTRAGEFDLVVVNLARHRSQCYVPITIDELANHTWLMRDLLGEECYERRGEDLQNEGLYLDVPPHAAQLFHCQSVGGGVNNSMTWPSGSRT